MRAPLLLELPHAPSPDSGDDAALAESGHQELHSPARLAVYGSSRDSGRPRFIGPAPQLSWQDRLRARLHRMLGRESAT